MYPIKKVICFLASIICCSNLLAQTFSEVLAAVDKLASEEEKITYLDEIITGETHRNHNDTLALLYLEKSHLLFRNNISIARAIQALDEGLNLVTLDKNKDIWLDLWYYKGYWYRKWDKYNEAKEALNKVLAIKDNNPREWSATIQLGKTYKDRGDFALALDTYDKAILLAGDNKYRLTSTYEVISFVYLIMNSEEGAKKAIPWLEKLIAMLKTMEDEAHFTGSMTYNLGTAYHTLNDLEKAEYYYSQAEAIVNECCEDDDFKSLLLESRASILADRGEYDKALSLFDQALKLYQESFDLTRSDGLASTYHQIADIHRKNKNPQKALEFINRALGYRLAGIDPDEKSVSISIERLRSNGEKHYLIDELITKSKILKDQYERTNDSKILENALAELEYGDLLVDLMRFEQIEESSKLFWREKTNEVYDLLVEISYALNKKEEAFHYSEKAKYLLTGEHLVQKNTDRKIQSISEELLSRYNAVQSEVDQAILSKLDLEVTSRQNQMDSIDLRISDLRKEQDDLLIKIRTEYPEYYKANFTFSIATIEDVRDHILNNNQLLLEFYINDNDLYIFSISHSAYDIIKLENSQALLQNIILLRETITSADRMESAKISKYKELAYKVYTQTIGTTNHENYTDLIIINDDVLSLIPFSVLLTESADHYSTQQLAQLPYLVKTKNISYLQSASLTVQLNQSTSNRFTNQVLACRPSFGEGNQSADEFRGYDVVRGSLEPLYGAEQELLHLKASVSGDFLENDAANESGIKSAFKKPYSIIHLASHAVVDNEQPEFSRLVLHEDDNEDGYLHAYEIQNMNIESDLIVLSACNTGYGKLEKGEGINSLGNAFVKAGSPNLLTSLWPVSDKSTADLMTRFYNQLLEGKTIKNSLHLSQLDFSQSMPAALQHPYYWGGFVYYGDNRSIEFKAASTPSPWHLMALGIIGLTGIIIYFFKNRSWLRRDW